MNTIESRRSERTSVNVKVKVETVLEKHEGRITDLSETGAKIEGHPFEVGKKVKISTEDGAVWGVCRWAEVDRMGIQFDTPMPEQLRQLLKSNMPANDTGRQRPVFGRKLAV